MKEIPLSPSGDRQADGLEVAKTDDDYNPFVALNRESGSAAAVCAAATEDDVRMFIDESKKNGGKDGEPNPEA